MYNSRSNLIISKIRLNCIIASHFFFHIFNQRAAELSNLGINKELTNRIKFYYLISLGIFIIILLAFQNSGHSTNMISNVFANSPSVVRQEIIDDENDWQPWNIENDRTSKAKFGNKNTSSNSEIPSSECKEPPVQLPNIQSVSYMSDGNKLNVTLWLSHTFSEVIYEDILQNNTSLDDLEGSPTSLLSKSTLPRIAQFVIAIDIVSNFNKAIDYIVVL